VFIFIVMPGVSLASFTLLKSTEGNTVISEDCSHRAKIHIGHSLITLAEKCKDLESHIVRSPSATKRLCIHQDMCKDRPPLDSELLSEALKMTPTLDIYSTY
jgi:hypothetical protein